MSYSGNTTKRGVLMKNIADSVPSISSFLETMLLSWTKNSVKQ